MSDIDVLAAQCECLYTALMGTLLANIYQYIKTKCSRWKKWVSASGVGWLDIEGYALHAALTH